MNLWWHIKWYLWLIPIFLVSIVVIPYLWLTNQLKDL